LIDWNHLMTHPLLVFDLDGTLVDSARDLSRTLDYLLERDGLAPIGYDNIRKVVGQGAKVKLQPAYALNDVTIDATKTDALFNAFLEHYEAHIADYTVPFDGVDASLQRFADAGWRFAICTNNLESLSRKLIDELGMSDKFETICGADTFSAKKPDPLHLTETIAKAGGSVERAIMVGDSRPDIEAAQAANVPVVAVDFGYTDTPVVELNHDIVISHFDSLWDAVAQLRPNLISRTNS